MQIAAPAPRVTTIPAPGTPPHGPIGVGSVGTMRIGYALNGVAYQDYRLTMPITNPAGIFRGSYADALTGAKALAGQLGNDAVLALNMAQPGEWVAMQLSVDHDVARAINNGAGHGGIASIEYTSLSRSLAALVTASTVVEPHTA